MVRRNHAARGVFPPRPAQRRLPCRGRRGRNKNLAGGIRMLKKPLGLLLAALLAGLPLSAQPQSADKLMERYAPLAGSTGNAKSLVEGLRNDTPVTLQAANSKTTFTPPTGKMGYGNVDN